MNELEKLRSQIDKVDNEILKNLSRRIRLSRKVGEYKIKNNLPILDNGRWNKLIKGIVVKGEKLDVHSTIINEVWNAIHKNSINNQKP
jgi:chorismate mutase